MDIKDMNVRELFEKAVRIVRPVKRDKVVLPLSFLESLFELSGARYHAAPSMTGAIHHYIDMPISVRDINYGRTRAYFKNPNQTLTVKGEPSQFLDVPDEESYQIPASAAILVHNHLITRWKHSLAIVIRLPITSIASRPVAFGFYGTYNNKGELTVRRLIMPEADSRHVLSDAKRVDITQESVLRGLAYAELCMGQMLAGDNMSLRANLAKANELEIKGAMPPWKDKRWAAPPPAP